MRRTDLPGFESRDDIKHAGLCLPVYVSTAGTKPLVVLHELPGMTPSFIRFSQQMVNEGYKVFMPLLFNEPNSKMGSLRMAAFCLSKEFRQLFQLKSKDGLGRPFPRWLLHLTDVVAGEHTCQNIGVIGMCLTGGFAIAAIADQRVGAVAACQPAFPFFRNVKTLGLTQAQRQACVDRVKAEPVPCAIGYRYSKDVLCRESHMRAIEQLLGQGFVRYPDLDGAGHSTVTDEDSSKNEIVFKDIVRFMNERLRAPQDIDE